MGRYEDLLKKYDYISINETGNIPKFMSGFYMNGEIFINSNRPTTIKLETLAEELAHHEITYGNILDDKDIQNRKYELKARRLACEILIPLNELINAFLQGIHNLYELANFFEVTESFVLQSIEHYKQKYGYSTRYGKYVIQFEPLRVFRLYEVY
ncbi:ImmA/IrrE family metallo-endopeptidase [Staphylococcus haemolyticus]|uniref:ImmA/IrrE family metallo-endopeptidase n=1 Tax=Staphylococcus haemolyticus TaxID=1283 RepID=UPI0028A3FF1E|nr:ImmA/IrrE family metallo-endopeptidase [Staphylococcus haemolyticus]MDT4239060.1 ImmA/IrrE family metallo-endopeptidase [Staphylococcus haemolyticus]MDT4297869.1 ImmA/IrrE family metallo-endopeptidase [Staphylococcus haemolyticus]MDT4300253.1 ImmA/IrrE family metallo-endopeptidase [Staphylococcus haemolyticus]MDT4312482.1 ImmA/IrrE family metallo-endopeptidase [Staphylococcus haemolyticus]MDT4316991.1 ImmA/IrrE family metallo-endopeptidase [Staphylococcus haemolyticus]